MRCHKCKMPISDIGLDRCFCAPEKTISAPKNEGEYKYFVVYYKYHVGVLRRMDTGAPEYPSYDKNFKELYAKIRRDPPLVIGGSLYIEKGSIPYDISSEEIIKIIREGSERT